VANIASSRQNQLWFAFCSEGVWMAARIVLVLACFLLGSLAGTGTSRAIPISDPPPVLTAGSATTNVGDEFTIPISVANTQVSLRSNSIWRSTHWLFRL
jgi:hypothetical protein